MLVESCFRASRLPSAVVATKRRTPTRHLPRSSGQTPGIMLRNPNGISGTRLQSVPGTGPPGDLLELGFQGASGTLGPRPWIPNPP